MNIRLEGHGVDENSKCIIEVDPRCFPFAEVETLLGDSGKARNKLGWLLKASFDDLVAEMVVVDLETAERDHLSIRSGYKSMSYFE